jgi:predicted NBD/HSP70 family sugar kinase
MTQKLVLAYDLGGTKVHAGIVNERGKICREVRALIHVERGRDAVLRELTEIGRALLKEFPKAKRVGLASAGPLDIQKGVLLDPTNYLTDGKGWGQVPIVKSLSKGLNRPVLLENDAAAALLAEHWMGVLKKKKNVMILTLGTGMGVGVLSNGVLERSGRMLHPEAGHLIIRADDETAPCGCGNLGCAEAFLSGKNFTQRVRKLTKQAEITTEEICDEARRGNPKYLSFFDEYARLFAISLNNWIRLYAPEVVALTGSFAQASDLFLPRAEETLEKLLSRLRDGVDMLPQIRLSTLDNRAGLLGAAHVALFRR